MLWLGPFFFTLLFSLCYCWKVITQDCIVNNIAPLFRWQHAYLVFTLSYLVTVILCAHMLCTLLLFFCPSSCWILIATTEERYIEYIAVQCVRVCCAEDQKNISFVLLFIFLISGILHAFCHYVAAWTSFAFLLWDATALFRAISFWNLIFLLLV